jgi:hypothetical protein
MRQKPLSSNLLRLRAFPKLTEVLLACQPLSSILRFNLDEVAREEPSAADTAGRSGNIRKRELPCFCVFMETHIAQTRYQHPLRSFSTRKGRPKGLYFYGCSRWKVNLLGHSKRPSNTLSALYPADRLVSAAQSSHLYCLPVQPRSFQTASCNFSFISLAAQLCNSRRFVSEFPHRLPLASRGRNGNYLRLFG